MKLSLGKVLAALSGVMILVAGVQGVSSIRSMVQIEDGIDVIVRQRVPGFIVIGAINADIGSIRNAQGAIVIADPDARADFQAELSKADSALTAKLKEYREYLVDDADKQHFESFTRAGPRPEQVGASAGSCRGQQDGRGQMAVFRWRVECLRPSQDQPSGGG